MVSEQLDIIWGKKGENLNVSIILNVEMNSEYIIYLNFTCDTVKLAEDNTGEKSL